MAITREQGIEQMKTAARAKPLSTLAGSLAILSAMPELDDAGRLTQAVIVDVICERSPEANAAMWAWAESDDKAGEELEGGPAAVLGAVLAAL